MKTALEKGMESDIKPIESMYKDGIDTKVIAQIKKRAIKIALQNFADKVEKQGLKHNDKKSKHLVIWNYEWKQLKKQEGLK